MKAKTNVAGVKKEMKRMPQRKAMSYGNKSNTRGAKSKTSKA